ncbi:MAG: PilW family protein [Bacillota bacterium]
MIDQQQAEGFTLIEIMITLAIVGLVGTAIMNLMFSGVKVWDFSRQQIDLRQSGRATTELLAKRIRSAEAIQITSAEGITGGQLRLRISGKDDQFINDSVADDQYYYLRYLLYKVDSGYRIGYNNLEPGDDSISTDVAAGKSWPSDADWDSSPNPVTTSIIDYATYDDRGEDIFKDSGRVVTIKLHLKIGSQRELITTKVYPRSSGR